MENSTAHSQFVLQQHTFAGRVHWDLMLEKAGKLWTWRLEEKPTETYGPVAAERIFDHPLKFLTYEGPVQNNTGRVCIADKGGLHFKQIEADTITADLNGSLLKGIFVLRIEHPPIWMLSKRDA